MICWAVITYYAFKERKWYNIVISLITVFIYTIFGSRGAVLCVAGYLLFCVIYFTRKKQRFYLIIIGGLITGVITMCFTTMIQYFVSILNTLGIPSYTLTNILRGSFFYSNARLVLYKKMLEAIAENPWGYGLGYDRTIGGSAGLYAHNMFLELFISFGIIFGGIIAVFIVCIYIYMFIKCKSGDYLALFSVFAVPGFIMLQLSGSLFINYHLMIALLIFVMYLQTNKKTKIESAYTREGVIGKNASIDLIQQEYTAKDYKI